MIINYLTEMIECLRPDMDDSEFDAYVLDEDTSEHSPLNLDLEMNRFNTNET